MSSQVISFLLKMSQHIHSTPLATSHKPQNPLNSFSQTFDLKHRTLEYHLYWDEASEILGMVKMPKI